MDLSEAESFSVTDISLRLEEYRRRVDEALACMLASLSFVPPRLEEAIKYSVLAGGKRIRPALCLMTAEGLGAKHDVMRAACAIELIHTYSLIHDDLPAMDNDDLRRGKPTSHKMFGEALAILAGDALQAMAFEWLAALKKDGIPADRINAAISKLAEAAGPAGMVGGQVLDIESENRRISIEDLRRIHRLKTGALLEASVVIGAVLAGASSQEELLLAEYGRHIGLLFQIVDDILDVAGNPEQMGKNVGGDAECGKASYPALLGMKNSEKEAALARDKAVFVCRKLPRPVPELADLAEWLLVRNH